VATMRRTVELALQNGVAIGAHPGYKDRENFGRTKMDLETDEVESLINEQLESLSAICATLGTKLRHVKPHGALYNQAAVDRRLASSIAETVAAFDRTLLIYGLSGSFIIEEAERVGIVTASEVFADRTYLSDGTLTPRSRPKALIADNETAVDQVLDMVKYGRVRSADAIMVPITADTICLHGDGTNAVAFARLIREHLAVAGVRIAPPLA
jgi:5-oxoprolinase (ATP-hydrolysing) subunit A